MKPRSQLVPSGCGLRESQGPVTGCIFQQSLPVLSIPYFSSPGKTSPQLYSQSLKHFEVEGIIELIGVQTANIPEEGSDGKGVR